MAAATARTGVLTWTESGQGSEAGLVAAAPQAWGDVVLARKDMPTSYHLSVVVDDALQGVADVVRGQDLVNQRAPLAPGAARPASTDLPSPPPDP
jgi:glutamyl-Q tRNA(Asp) synthetase